jgi:hypothetical protein
MASIVDINLLGERGARETLRTTAPVRMACPSCLATIQTEAHLPRSPVRWLMCSLCGGVWWLFKDSVDRTDHE